MALQVNLAGERLYRFSQNAWIFGICSANAKRFNTSPLLVRALFVMLSWTVVVPIFYLAAGFSIHSDLLAD